MGSENVYFFVIKIIPYRSRFWDEVQSTFLNCQQLMCIEMIEAFKQNIQREVFSYFIIKRIQGY